MLDERERESRNTSVMDNYSNIYKAYEFEIVLIYSIRA